MKSVSVSSEIYRESFDHGPGGWFGWKNNLEGPEALAISDGIAIARSPWWIDYNHAPPGAGYLHMLFCLLTKGPGFGEAYMEAGGYNQFVEGGFSTNFTNAIISVRLKGELETRGAELILLVQSSASGVTSGWALKSQPIGVTSQWTEQAINLNPDSSRWICLGSRHDRTKSYGRIDLKTVLQDVVNIVFILFPLTVVPMGPIPGDPNILRAGKDYPVWRSRLPEGYVMLDEIRIQFNRK